MALADPFEMLSSLMRRLPQADSPAQVVEAVRESLKLGRNRFRDCWFAIHDPRVGIVHFPLVLSAGTEVAWPSCSLPMSPPKVVGYVLENRQSIWSHKSVSETEEIASRLCDEDLSAAVCVPLLYGDVLLGAIGFGSDQQNLCGEECRKMLDVFAHVVATSIANAWHLEERRRNETYQRRILEVVGEINSNSDLGAILGMVRDTIVEECGFDRAAIFIYDEANNVVQGVWGTSPEGEREDLSLQTFSLSDDDQHQWGLGTPKGPGYVFAPNYEALEIASKDGRMRGVRQHGIVHLRACEEVVGFVAVDNLPTQRPFGEADLKKLLPLAATAATAIKKSRLIEIEKLAADKQRRLMELTATMNETSNLSLVLRLVRDAAVEVGGFDRAGVFLLDEKNGLMTGTWGTDREGRLEDICEDIHRITAEQATRTGLGSTEGPGYVLVQDFSGEFDTTDRPTMRNVHQNGIVHLRASGRNVGFLAVDNLITNRRITENELKQLLPFAAGAASAIQKARLIESEKRALRQQRRLLELTAAINESDDLDHILRLVRDAIVDVGGFDRAGVYIYDRSSSMMRGTWGTDRDGRPEDIHREVIHVGKDASGLPDLGTTNSLGYVLLDDYSEMYDVSHVPSMQGVRTHGMVHLLANGEDVGFIGVDNVITGRPITHEALQLLLPFAHEAATAIQKTRLLVERERMVKQQRRLMEVAVAIGANKDLDGVFRLVRDAVLDLGVVDRASVWVTEGQTLLGRYGTDTEGRPKDEHDRRVDIKDIGIPPNFGQGDRWHYTDLVDRVLPDGRVVRNVPHAVIGLRAAGELVGFLMVDTLLTMRAIDEEMLQPLLPFTQEAAVAVQKAWLLRAQQQTMRRQQRLMQMAVAISAQQDMDVVFRLVCEAIQETGFVDNVSLWLSQDGTLRGTFAVGLAGTVQDESSIARPMSECSAATRQLIETGDPYVIGTNFEEDNRLFPYCVVDSQYIVLSNPTTLSLSGTEMPAFRAAARIPPATLSCHAKIAVCGGSCASHSISGGLLTGQVSTSAEVRTISRFARAR